jgi:hypothetical protein
LFVFFHQEVTILCLSYFSYYDQSVLDFLQEFGRNSPFTNVNLELHGENHRKFDAMSKVMAQLLPSITSIESLRSYDYDHNAALFQEELSDMLTSARILNGRSVFIIIIKITSMILNSYSFQSFWRWL